MSDLRNRRLMVQAHSIAFDFRQIRHPVVPRCTQVQRGIFFDQFMVSTNVNKVWAAVGRWSFVCDSIRHGVLLATKLELFEHLLRPFVRGTESSDRRLPDAVARIAAGRAAGREPCLRHRQVPQGSWHGDDHCHKVLRNRCAFR